MPLAAAHRRTKRLLLLATFHQAPASPALAWSTYHVQLLLMASRLTLLCSV